MIFNLFTPSDDALPSFMKYKAFRVTERTRFVTDRQSDRQKTTMGKQYDIIIHELWGTYKMEATIKKIIYLIRYYLR